MLTLTDADFTRLYTYIQQHYGINLSHKKQLIASRLTNMLQQKGFHDFSESIDEIISGQDPEMVSVMQKSTPGTAPSLSGAPDVLLERSRITFLCI